MLNNRKLTSFNEGKLNNYFYNFNKVFGLKLKNDRINAALALSPYLSREFAKQGYYLDTIDDKGNCVFKNSNNWFKINGDNLPTPESFGRQIPFRIYNDSEHILSVEKTRSTGIEPVVFPFSYDNEKVSIEIPYLEEGAHAVFLATLDSALTIGHEYDHLQITLSSADQFDLVEIIAIINQIVADKNRLICQTQSASSSVKKYFTNGKPYALFKSIIITPAEIPPTQSTTLFCNLMENMGLNNIEINTSFSLSPNMVGYQKFPLEGNLYQQLSVYLIANGNNQCHLHRETYDQLMSNLKNKFEYIINE